MQQITSEPLLKLRLAKFTDSDPIILAMVSTWSLLASLLPFSFHGHCALVIARAYRTGELEGYRSYALHYGARNLPNSRDVASSIKSSPSTPY